MEIPDFTSSNPAFVQAFQKVAKAEQRPIQRIDEKMQREQGKLDLVRDFKNRVSEMRAAMMSMRNVRDFRELVGKSSNPDVLDTSAIDKNLADVGKYDFEVLNLANTDSIMTYGFTDPDKSEVGVGYIEFETPAGETKEVYINSEDNSLRGVAKKINSARLGVKAFVVHDGTDSSEPWRLVISGEGTGWKEDNNWPTFYMLDGDLEFDKERERDAKSAIVRFNGHPVMLDENKIDEILPGVTLDLKKAMPGEKIFYEVTPDIKAMGDKVQTMVDSINSVLDFIQKQNQLDAKSHKDPSKALGGDVAIQAIESRVRNLIQRTQNALGGAQIQRLSDIGVQFNRSGLLDFDPKKLDYALNNNFDEVAALISGTQPLQGFANDLIALADGVTRSGDGMMSVRERNLSNTIDRMEREKEQVEERVQDKLERAKREFSRAEGAIQQMQQLGSQLGGGGGPAALIGG